MTHIKLLLVLLLSISIINIRAQKINFDALNKYSEFLNFGDKKINKINKGNLENAIFKSKLDTLGELFKKSVDSLKLHDNLEIVFLVDASSSVGYKNFQCELKFVKKLLSDITVDFNHTRIAIITYSSSTEINVNVDEISQPSKSHNKCFLLNNQLGGIEYRGGDTYTLGALEAAKNIFENSHRNNSKQALFLITDGYSNGGDPVPLSLKLKEKQIMIFTIGIRNGNYKELYQISSSPGEFYSYLLDSFDEFEGLARRALHLDLKNGDYVPLELTSPCDHLCKEGNCCDSNAVCSCGTTTGHYSCVCKLGYYGSGLNHECFPCSDGTYSIGPNTCLPCPDINHETTIPAIGLTSCKCKIGYQEAVDNKCKILKCPKIQIPDHGYLVKKRECGNVVNSACGIRCEVGYTLIGNSIRLCQANASWSGMSPACEVKVCTPLVAPKFGSINCTHSDLEIESNKLSDLPVDTVCSFKCNKGMNLIGSRQRTCLPLSRWDGLRTLCKPIKCNKLTVVKNGFFEPKNCTVGKQEYGKNCTIRCYNGFKIKGPKYHICNGVHGNWNHKLEDTICIDITAPNLLCPFNITINTIPGKKFAHTNWQVPNVTDNSEDDISIWMKPVIKNVANFKFYIGNTRIRYYAQDASGNKINCSFFVTVKDNERPIIEDCIDPPTFLTSDKNGANVTWDDPYIFDNSQFVKIFKSHEFGFFNIGTTTVTYTASDLSNNTNICKLNITVEEALCEALPDPIFGQSKCAPEGEGVQCVITCEEGYAIPLNQDINIDSNATSFYCKHSDPIWLSQDGLNFPECSITEIPEISSRTGELDIKSTYDLCDNPELYSTWKDDISNTLVNKLCEDSCSLNATYNCKKEKTEEETNMTKRDVSRKNRTIGYKSSLNIKFQVQGKSLTNFNQAPIDFSDGRRGSLSLSPRKFKCPLGFVPRKKRCVRCPRGTFHNTTINKCDSCALGFYNNKSGQIACTPCPINKSTRKFRSKSLKECKDSCPPGTFAKKKIIRRYRFKQNITVERPSLSPHCRSCKIGYYQFDYGKLNCLPCPKGYTTTSYRSVNISQCIPLDQKSCQTNKTMCYHGSCEVININQFQCNCFQNYYGNYCEKKLNPCSSNPCLNNGLCSIGNDETTWICNCPKGFSGKYCQDIDSACKLNCKNNGICIESEENDYFCLCPEGYGGDFCEMNIKYCNENICENNGLCINEKHAYKCVCSLGYLGRRCSVLPCDYQPCNNTSTCINLMEPNATKNSYRCVCPTGYRGTTCSEKIDHCSSQPCKNNGTCMSDINSYKCDCSNLYGGVNCEIRKETNYLLEFPRYDTNDFIHLKGFTENISKITACLWMETTDEFNYGTLISYASKHFDNSFTITDYTGLILYINNKYIVTDILLNDGFWHHICASWEGINGTYKIYVDGKLRNEGINFMTNSVIEGYGNLIIGQEQDIMGGKFSQSESFMGKMAYLDIWSDVLTESAIVEHMNDCNNTILGNLYAWPKIQDHVFGNIKVIHSKFCRKCKEPTLVFNGVIEVIKNIAYYTCYPGYSLSNNVYEHGRRCSKMSTWEGISEPHCKKVYCGYPGYVRNANAIGRNYYYKDQITYTCYVGYLLQGNSTITCNKHGVWEPKKPECVGKQCPLLKVPENGNMEVISDYISDSENVTKTDVGTQIEITCNSNYNLTGENLLTCLETGKWDYPVPSCVSTNNVTTTKLDCSMDMAPKIPENGYIDLDSIWAASNGTTNYILYKCRTGYILNGNNNSTCIIDGYWTEVNISCKPVVCSKPRKPLHMRQKYKEEIKSTYIFGNKITYECQNGYKQSGDLTIRCQDDSKWTGLLGKCTKTCQKPFVADTTTITGSSFDIGSSIVIKCGSGSEYTLVCNQRGSWTGNSDSTC